MKPPTSPSRAETLQGSAQSLLQGLNVSIYHSSHDVILHFSTVTVSLEINGFLTIFHRFFAIPFRIFSASEGTRSMVPAVPWSHGGPGWRCSSRPCGPVAAQRFRRSSARAIRSAGPVASAVDLADLYAVRPGA